MQREISRNHTGDWDEQRERLSAYLDGELGEGEQEALERHIPTCEQCQRTLDEFREVRSLLHAMPIPTLPRSFAIPTEGAIPVPLASAMREGAERTGHQQQQQQRRRRVGGLWSGVAQAVGGFVAAAGVVLVLGSALMGVGRHLHSASMPVNGSTGSAASQSGQNGGTSSAYGSRQATSTEASSPQATPKATDQNKGVPTPTATAGTNQRETVQTAPYDASVPVVPIGAGMVAGGAVLFVAGRVSGSRRNRGRA